MNDPRTIQILTERAQRLARRVDQTPRTLRVDVAVVEAGRQRFGIPALALRVIAPMPALAPVPGAPGWLRGIGNVRGDLIGVVDLLVLAGQSAAQGSHLAVVEGSRGAFGLAIDGVHGFRAVFDDEISPLGADPSARFASAVTDDLLAILDIELVQAAQFQSQRGHE